MNEGLFSFVSGLLRRTVATTLGLPDELHTVLPKVKKGEIEINNPDIRNGARLLYALGQQLIFTLLLNATATFCFMLYKEGAVEYARFGYWIGGFFLFMLFWAMRSGRKYW